MVGNFDEGYSDVFSGPSQLGECYNFAFMENSQPFAMRESFGKLNRHIKLKLSIYVFFLEMTISHQGTDAAMFEYIRVMSTTGVNYQCDVDQIFIDDEQYLTTDMCFIL